MTEKFTINSSLPTLNEYIEAERRNKFAAAKLKKNATECVEWYAQAQAVILPKNTLFDIEIDWYRKDNRHDSDNVFFGVKFILDGLVKVKKLQNDGRKSIRNIRNNIITDKNSNSHFCIVKFNEVEV